MTLTLETLLAFAVGGAFGAALLYGIMRARVGEMAMRLALQDENQTALRDTFAALSAEALNKNNQQFLTLANENLAKFQQQADSNLSEKQLAIQQMIQPVSESLQKMDGKINELEAKREGAYGELRVLVNAMKDQHVVLHNQTASLAQALRAPTIRGQWGEMQLKRLLDLAGIVENVHYTRQAAVSGMRPDVMIHLPPDKVILLDAKVPMQNYLLAMQQDISESEKENYFNKHANDLKSHIKVLSSREYTAGFNSFDWVIMFVPLDGIMQAAFDKQPDLLEFAWKQNVILATPTNLLGLMRTVSYAHDQFKVNENAKEIAKIGETIYKRISIFASHLAKMGKSLDSATDHYNSAIGSLEKNVLSGLRQVKSLGIATTENDIAPAIAIENVPRKITAPELLEQEVA